MRRILAIDGGGIRGLIPALVLQTLEAELGRPIAQCFDLIAGTSTGGILALGLAKPGQDGKPEHKASDLVKLYEEHGRVIFKRSFWRGVTSIGNLTEERYPANALETVLQRYLGAVPLRQSVTDVLVTAYDIERRQPFFFKSWRGDRNAVPMWQAGRATSAAPTFFEPARIEVDGQLRALIDGGVFVNNPAMSAYAEVCRRHGPEDILVVSLGTGELTRPIGYEEAASWGLAQWASPLLNVIFDGVSDAVDYQLDQILGEQRYFRFQTPLELASDDMDNACRANLFALRTEAEQILNHNALKLARVIELLGAD